MDKYLGKINIKFVLCKPLTAGRQGVRPAGHGNSIVGCPKADRGKLSIPATASKGSQKPSPPNVVSHIKAAATLRRCLQQEEAADVGEICCVISSAVTER